MVALRKYRFTLMGLASGLLIYATTFIYDLCLFERLTEAMLWVTAHGVRLDEMLLTVLLAALGLAVDMSLRHRAFREEIRTVAMKASMVRSTTLALRDSVLNTYNGFQLVIMKAREGKVPDDLLDEMEKRIGASSRELNSLTGMQEIIKKEISSGGRYIVPKHGGEE